MHNQPHTDAAKEKMRAARLGVPALWKRRPSKVVDGVILFRCGKCRSYLPKNGFYKNNRTILGIKSECKKCHCETLLTSRDKENSRRLGRESMRRRRRESPEQFRARERQHLRKKDARTAARDVLNRAVRSGNMIRPSVCSSCQRTGRITAHHADYSKPLAVEWLCYECHGRLHRKSVTTTPKEAKG